MGEDKTSQPGGVDETGREIDELVKMFARANLGTSSNPATEPPVKASRVRKPKPNPNRKVPPRFPKRGSRVIRNALRNHREAFKQPLPADSPVAQAGPRRKS